MIDAILKDPSAITIIAMLVTAIAAFVRGDVMPGRTHDKILAREIATREAAIADIRQECNTWKAIAMRSVDLADKTTGIAEKAAGK